MHYPVVEGVVVGEPVSLEGREYHQPSSIPAEARRLLAASGSPEGLTNLLNASLTTFPVRIWVVDNSGSMTVCDGQRLVTGSNGSGKILSCSRWQELSETVMRIGSTSAAFGVRTDFHLLNRTADGQYLSVGADGQSSPVPIAGEIGDLATLQKMMSSSPSGTTPLTEAVITICSMLETAEAKLRSRGQQAVVVIATDGLPNDKPTFLESLRRLQKLPAWVVVRLCTNQDDTVQYWSDLDKCLESPLEVLDDLSGEADEIAKLNPWLTYAQPLQLAREFGLRDKLFDLLDEITLLPSQIKQFCELLLGCDLLPEPEVDVNAFIAQLEVALKTTPIVFDTISGSSRHWINIKTLKRTLKGDAGCVLS
mmetsp:Transcript_29238/g.48504  ORF Transcript_29238/g.48504 Transcript_29238/m.48504 type:complete len:366 (-) Transcript_29238:225-1322(-)